MTTAPAATAALTLPAIDIALAAIAISKTAMQAKRRERFNKEDLDQLAATIKGHGVLLPVLVRPVALAPTINKTGEPFWLYELVAGERRYLASQLAGKATIPAVVRELTDAEVNELQLIENVQREDLHPMDEAEGYAALLQCKHPDGKKFTADDIAARVGKSRRTVYATMQLTRLCPEARAAFMAGKIEKSVAELIARIPAHDVQRAALKQLTGTYHNGVPQYTYRTALEWVQNNCMLDLKEAPFDRADTLLVSAAGACADCPKRSGSNPALYPELKSADICTDPKCYGEKKEAHAVRLIAVARKKGAAVIEGAEAKKIFQYEHSDPKGFVRAGDEDHLGGKYTTFAKALGKDLPAAKLVVNPFTKQVEEIIPDKDIEAALKAKGIKRGALGRSGGDKFRAEQRNREAKAKVEKAWRGKLHLALRPKFAGGLSRQDLDLVAAELVGNLGDEGRKLIAALWIHEPAEGKKKPPSWEASAAVEKRIPGLTDGELFILMMDCALAADVHVNSYQVNTKPEALLAAAARYKVDAEPIRKAAMDEAKAKVAGKKTPAKKAKAPK